MVCDNVNREGGALQVMSPGLKCLKYCQKFLVMNVVIQLRRDESVGMESDWVEFGIGGVDGKDCSESIDGLARRGRQHRSEDESKLVCADN